MTDVKSYRMEPNTRLMSRERSQKLGNHTQGSGIRAPGRLSSSDVQAPHCHGLLGQLGRQNEGSWRAGSAPAAGGTFPHQAVSLHPVLGRWILNHWSIREVLQGLFF